MPNDTKTRKKTLRSSLCKKVSFTVPTSWGQLTQQQLHNVLHLLALYADEPGGMQTAKLLVLRYFCGFSVVRHTDAGWLCQLDGTGDSFILSDALLPSMEEQVSWLDHPEDMTVRLETVDTLHAVDIYFRDLSFGDYLKCENYYQYYLQSKDNTYLLRMFHILYQAPQGKEPLAEPYVLLSVFFWYTATKKYYSQVFTHFLKTSDSSPAVTPQSQRELMTAQIRLLTKGDVTKNQQVLNIPAWDALVELDALARESEEFKQKYGKQPL